MIPRVELVLLDLRENAQSARRQAYSWRYRWLLVHDGSADQVCGIIAKADVLHHTNWQAYVRQLPSLLSSLPAHTWDRQVPTLVIDEHGGTAGLLLSEACAADPVFSTMPAELAGRTSCAQAGRLLGIALPGRAYTLAGWFVERLGHFASIGEAINLGTWRLIVADVDEHGRVGRVRIESSPRGH